MKKALALALGIVFVLGFAGCEIFNPGVDYFPVKAGQIWTYETVKHDSTYYVATDSSAVKDSTWETTSKCVGETTLDNGTKVWEFENEAGKSYMAFEKETVDFYAAKADTTPLYSIPKKLEVGSKWDIPVNDTTNITWEAKSTEDVTVTAGTYAGALKISVTTPGVEMENWQWWDKDAGTVKAWTKAEIDVPDVMFMLMETTTQLKSIATE
ncbi:hypothetical protein GX441_08735 [bacterium]|nr:hypothetical protein [bacterium]